MRLIPFNKMPGLDCLKCVCGLIFPSLSFDITHFPKVPVQLSTLAGKVSNVNADRSPNDCLEAVLSLIVFINRRS